MLFACVLAVLLTCTAASSPTGHDEDSDSLFGDVLSLFSPEQIEERIVDTTAMPHPVDDCIAHIMTKLNGKATVAEWQTTIDRMQKTYSHIVLLQSFHALDDSVYLKLAVAIVCAYDFDKLALFGPIRTEEFQHLYFTYENQTPNVELKYNLIFNVLTTANNLLEDFSDHIMHLIKQEALAQTLEYFCSVNDTETLQSFPDVKIAHAELIKVYTNIKEYDRGPMALATFLGKSKYAVGYILAAYIRQEFEFARLILIETKFDIPVVKRLNWSKLCPLEWILGQYIFCDNTRFPQQNRDTMISVYQYYTKKHALTTKLPYVFYTNFKKDTGST